MAERPRSLPAFEVQFPDDAACARWLFEKRWPDGFRCPGCGHDKGWELGRGLLLVAGACTDDDGDRRDGRGPTTTTSEAAVITAGGALPELTAVRVERLGDRPAFVDADGLPFVFERFRLNGVVPSLEALVDADLQGTPVPFDASGAGERRRQGIAGLEVVEFP